MTITFCIGENVYKINDVFVSEYINYLFKFTNLEY